MRIAWFRPAPLTSDPLDDLGLVIAALASDHTIDIINEPDAHDFVWRHARRPYDLCVYELDNTAGHQFLWPYLLHFPGVIALRSTTLHDSRAAALAREQRHDDYGIEMEFGGTPRRAMPRWSVPRGQWPMLRAPLLASRLAVVHDPDLATALQSDYVGASVRYAPVGVSDPMVARSEASPRGTTFGVVDRRHELAIRRAAHRAETMGARMKLLIDADVPRTLREADVILALRWPSLGDPLTAIHAGMAASKVVVVSETYATAAWPALNPQTWRLRDVEFDEPAIVVSVDPRDEEHSLMLALFRLSSDEALRQALGRAARAWWERHATIAHAVIAWRQILHEAVSIGPPPRPAGWPAHLAEDGTGRARTILEAFGASVDFLQQAPGASQG